MIVASLLLSFAASQQAGLPVAVLESGARVPLAGPSAAVGETRFATPYGEFHQLSDAIVEVVDAADEARMLRAVRASDFEAWLRRASERGLLPELLAALEEEGRSAAERDALLAELTAWGHRFDPVPAKVDWDDRIAWLWKRIEKTGAADAGRGALLLGALEREIPGSSAPADRRIGLVQLRRALRGKNEVLARAAAAVSAHQLELDMRRPLAEASMHHGRADVRLASAQSLFDLDPDEALGRWTLSLWRGDRSEERIRAAEYLGSYGNAKTVDALVYALASSSRPPGRYVFFGRQISYVADFDVEVAQAAAIADPQVNVLTEGTVLEVRIISTTVSRAVMQSLGRLTGADPGSKEEDWLRWYQETRMDG